MLNIILIVVSSQLLAQDQHIPEINNDVVAGSSEQNQVNPDGEVSEPQIAQPVFSEALLETSPSGGIEPLTPAIDTSLAAGSPEQNQINPVSEADKSQIAYPIFSEIISGTSPNGSGDIPDYPETKPDAQADLGTAPEHSSMQNSNNSAELSQPEKCTKYTYSRYIWLALGAAVGAIARTFFSSQKPIDETKSPKAPTVMPKPKQSVPNKPIENKRLQLKPINQTASGTWSGSWSPEQADARLAMTRENEALQEKILVLLKDPAKIRRLLHAAAIKQNPPLQEIVSTLLRLSERLESAERNLSRDEAIYRRKRTQSLNSNMGRKIIQTMIETFQDDEKIEALLELQIVKDDEELQGFINQLMVLKKEVHQRIGIIFTQTKIHLINNYTEEGIKKDYMPGKAKKMLLELLGSKDDPVDQNSSEDIPTTLQASGFHPGAFSPAQPPLYSTALYGTPLQIGNS